MILNKVRLNDFISHKHTELSLGYGINVVVGPNGAGKTSILDAISFALFSDYSNRGRKENLINSRASRCRAAVEFTEGGIKYAVEWSMERGKSARGNLYTMQSGEKKLLAQGGNAVVKEVEKILGIDKSMFLQSIYVRQGEIEELVTAKPADRKELISRLLGVEDLEKAWNNVKTVIDDYEKRANKLEGELTQKSTIEADKQKHSAASQELAASLASKRQDLGKIDDQISGLQSILIRLEGDKKEFDRLDREKTILEQSIEHGRENLVAELAELEKAGVAEKTIESLQDAVNKLPILEEYSRLLLEKHDAETKREALAEKLRNLERLEKTLEENKESFTLYVEKRALLDKKTEERKEYEGSAKALEKALKNVEDLEKEEQRRIAALNDELAECAKILGEHVTVETVEAVLQRKEEEFQTLADMLGEKVDEYKKRVGLLEHRKKELDDSLSKLEPSEAGVKTCPTCETDLTPDRLAQLIHKFSSEKEQIETGLQKFVAELASITHEKQQADVQLEKMVPIHSGRIKDLAVQESETRESLAEKRSEVEECRKHADELKRLDDELSALETKISRSEKAYMRFESAKDELARLPSRGQVEAEMMPVSETLEAISRKLKDSASTLGYEPQEPREELETLRRKKQEYDRNMPVAKRKLEHESNVARLKEKLSASEQKLSENADAIKRLKYDEKEHSRKQEEFDSLTLSRNEMGVAIAKMGERKKAEDDGASECDRKLEALAKKEREKLVVDGFVGLLNRIRAAYGKDGVQKMIRARARPLLERSTRDLFERFNLAYSDIKIDDDYDIAVIGPSGEQGIDQISGGERVALAIALRLAIAQVLSGKVETIIMDEPTTHLDEERRKELVNILSSFFREGGRIIPQMLIITHHPEIEDVADVIYTIRKENAYSIAEPATTSKETT
jgi:exonuclease SbcC